MAAGEAILSAFLQVFFDRLASRELIDAAQRWNIDSELKKLKRTLLKIKVVLNDAEEKQIKNDAVKMWLNDLNHVAYDAEDVLDEFATEALQWKLEADANQVWNFNIPTSLRPTVVWFKSEIGSKIKEIIEKLEDIAKQRFELGLREDVRGNSNGIRQRPPTSSLVDESGVYGREDDKKKIIELVLSDHEAIVNEVPVIPIVGMGGIGKTTLAQLVYNDKRVDEYFDLKTWACVSEEFDVLRVTKTILESVTGSQCNLAELDLLQVRLKEVLSGKKFLLVLDDVWNQNYCDWDRLRNPFISVAQGSRIIVTTRSVTVSSIMSNVHAHHLGVLSYEDCQSLFVKLAFANKNSDIQSKLEAIGNKIVDKCKGLPLAAKTIGGLLRSKVDEDEWEDILNSEIWELTDDENDILPALRLSYHHLPAHLKRCFGYCSIFPKDYKFQKEELVSLWMAEGFVQPKRKKRMEDVGGAYFDDLFQRSFFQQFSGYKCGFVMHDLVNDLARFVSGDVCFRLEGDDSYKISENARHLSYHSDKYDLITKFKAFYEMCLRTFLPLDLRTEDRYLPTEVPHHLFSRLKCLRVLCLSRYRITDLPDSIGNLRHLRYLDLSFTKIERLPESTCTLYNLQTLLLKCCGSLTKLPQNIGNLINLRHLDMGGCSRLQKMPLGIARLTSLQTLTNFVVEKNSGSLIRELRDISDLRGLLHISNVENIVNHMDAMEANLRNKQHIGRLALAWSSYGRRNFEPRDEGVEENVLDWLQPHRNLKQLSIDCYGGIRFPSWMGDPSFSNLVILSVHYCRKCKSLPPLGQLPSLQYLSIHGMDEVKSVGNEFCGDGSVKPFGSLKKLDFGDMPEWAEWSGLIEGECVAFPSLLELSIISCPKLRKVSHHFPVLVQLSIDDCEELTAFPKLLSRGNFEEGEEFPCLCDLTIIRCPKFLLSLRLPMLRKLCLESLDLCDETVLGSTLEVTSLTSLSIYGIPKLASLPEGFLQHSATLEELDISDCGELVALSEFGVHHLTSLRRLQISKCPQFQFVSVAEEEEGLPTNLQYLKIEYCDKMEKLPLGLHNLTSLRELIIIQCPGLVSLSDTRLPTTLKLLQFTNCMNIDFLPEEMMPNNSSLEKLVIQGCHSLTSFPRGLGLSSTTTAIKLKELEILECMNLESLPEGLHVLTSLLSLKISGCPRLVSFGEGGLPITNLKLVSIRACENLNSLPNKIHSLTSIQELEIESCPNLISFSEGGLPTNCKSLHILDCEKLELLTSWWLQRLTYLRHFTIGGFSSLISFTKWLLPTTLTSLHIERLLNLESLSDGLHNLTSIQKLKISECPKLASLPEEVLPTTLRVISIWKCPLLVKRCQKDEGEDWPKIAHIPCIGLDDWWINDRQT